jgi:hypothetical protein
MQGGCGSEEVHATDIRASFFCWSGSDAKAGAPHIPFPSTWRNLQRHCSLLNRYIHYRPLSFTADVSELSVHFRDILQKSIRPLKTEEGDSKSGRHTKQTVRYVKFMHRCYSWPEQCSLARVLGGKKS